MKLHLLHRHDLNGRMSLVRHDDGAILIGRYIALSLAITTVKSLPFKAKKMKRNFR